MPIKFGSNQLRNPTPHKVGILCDFLAALFGILTAFIMSAEFIPYSVSDIISPIMSGLMIPITLLVKRFFGVPQVDDEVPIEQVTEVETKPKTDK